MIISKFLDLLMMSVESDFYNFFKSGINEIKASIYFENSEAKSFITSRKILEEQNSSKIEKFLLNFSEKNKYQFEPLLCLRCKISSYITYSVKNLFNKHKSMHPIKLHEMLSQVLEDDGKKYFLYRTGNINIRKRLNLPLLVKDEKKRKIINWSFLENFDYQDKFPLGFDILITYKEDKAALSTWVSNKIKGNSELKEYLKERGVILQSDWTVIKGGSEMALKNAWLRIYEVEPPDYIKFLFNAFIEEYDKEKDIYRDLKKTNNGWDPSIEFRKRINPRVDPIKTLDDLGAIANALRRYKRGVYEPKSIQQIAESKDNKSEAFDEIVEDDKGKIFEALPQFDQVDILFKKDLKATYLMFLEKETQNFLNSFLKEELISFKKNIYKLIVWILYSKGLSNREIVKELNARAINYKQPWVAKVIRENMITGIIAREIWRKISSIKRFNDITNFIVDDSQIDDIKDSIRKDLTRKRKEIKYITDSEKKIVIVPSLLQQKIEFIFNDTSFLESSIINDKAKEVLKKWN